MNNFISIVNHFNLVIYADSSSVAYINTNNNPRIKVIIKPLTQFYNYKYKASWIENHKKNGLLNERTCWELNMLWSEKIQFVKETYCNQYFITDTYGWCDIGYFRNRIQDIQSNKLTNWAQSYPKDEAIIYACTCNDETYMAQLYQIVANKNENGLPTREIPAHQNSIAGGFFIIHKDKIDYI